MRKIRTAAITFIVVIAVFAGHECYSQGEGDGKTVDEQTTTPLEWLKQGRLAFQGNDFPAAEKAFGQFFSNYSENPEAKEALRIHRPFLALSKIGVAKYGEALVLIETSLGEGRLKAKLTDELSFWRAVCLMQAEDLVAAQEAFGEYWTNEKHEPFKRYEALLLFASLYVMQGFDAAAADFLKEQIPKIRKQAPEAAGRAVVLRMHALMKTGEREQALELLKFEYSNLDKMTQVISLQLQVLNLGAQFLQQKQYRKAIICLQRVWPKQKLLQYQGRRLNDLREREKKLEKQEGRQAVLFQIKAMVRRVEREVSQLQVVENFDSGLRLRLGIAYQAQGRYREAALVMEEMLKKMPVDPVVDSSSLALMQCWMQIKRWPKVIEAADLYLEKFGDWGAAAHLPEVMLLRAEAFKESKQNRQAAMAYGVVVEQFPEAEQAPAALFMQAYMYLLQDDSEGAVYHFDQLRRQHPEHALIDDADYWTAMSLSFSSEYREAKKWLERYLEKYGQQGKYGAEAKFRLAYCVFALGDSVQAIHLFQDFISVHGEHVLLDEAKLLLGDAYLGEGEIELGITSYRGIKPESKRFFEDAWFKTGKAFRLTGRFEKMRIHFEEFLQAYPDSSRMPEAVYRLGWVDRQNGNIARARQVYWDVFRRHGNDSTLFAIEDLLATLPQLYRDSGEKGDDELLRLLQELENKAKTDQQRVLALRCAWAIAQIYRGRDEKAYHVALLAATPVVKGETDRPRIVVDCADAQLAMGNHTVARVLYEAVRKWHPAAIERDRVFAGLGRIAEAKGESEQAIAYYERSERATASSLRLTSLKLDRARLLAGLLRGDEAKELLDDLLEDQTVASRSKAQALFASGELLMDAGEPRKAAAYYERIYVVYGKYRGLVARAYWRRGEALEKLKLPREAREVYEELVGRDDLKTFAEVKMATEKLIYLQQEGGSL